MRQKTRTIVDSSRNVFIFTNLLCVLLFHLFVYGEYIRHNCHVIAPHPEPRPLSNMAACLWSSVLLLCYCAVRVSTAPENLVPTVKYRVDLDQPPKERWVPILENFKGSVPLILEYFRSIVRAAATHHRTLSCVVTQL